MLILFCAFSSALQADVRLSGKTLTYSWTINTLPEDWSTPKYITFICDEKTLVWNNVTDKNKVISGVEKYELSEVSPGVLQISWKESPKTTDYGVILTFSFISYGIYGVLVNVDPEINYSVAGGFNIYDGIQAEKPLTGCP